MFKATIYFEAVKDNWQEGESLTTDNSWTETLTAETTAELRAKVLQVTYSDWKNIDDEQINDYDFATEYHTSYMADAANVGDASAAQIEQWKQGKLRLWAVNCHILVTEVIETKATL